MDFQNRVGSKSGAGGVASAQNEAIDRRERLRKLALETIDINKVFVRPGALGFSGLTPRCCVTGSVLHEEPPRAIRVQALSHAAHERGELPGPHAGEAPPVQPRASRGESLHLCLVLNATAHRHPLPPTGSGGARSRGPAAASQAEDFHPEVHQDRPSRVPCDEAARSGDKSEVPCRAPLFSSLPSSVASLPRQWSCVCMRAKMSNDMESR